MPLGFLLYVLAFVVDNKDVNLVDNISICTFDDSTCYFKPRNIIFIGSLALNEKFVEH